MEKIVIEKINNKDDAIKCNKLLEKLIQSERQFNENINSEYKVNNWFENFYSEDNNVIFIARDYEKIIGYVYVQITSIENGPMENKEALIDGLYIEKKYRGKGISKLLMTEAEMWAKENCVKYLYVNVLEENDKAINLYKKLNFNNFELKLKKEL